MQPRDAKPVTRRWVKPEVRRMIGGSAEQIQNSGADGSGFS
jgi:hypothetical protein